MKWKADTVYKTIWKTISIELITRDNFSMVFLTTVATNQGGTTDGQFNSTCPNLTPYSDIYLASNKTWSTRFTIASPKGASVAPSTATKPDGTAIPWGTRALRDPSKAINAPKVESSNTIAPSGLPYSTSLSNASASAASSAAAGSIKAESSGKATLVSLSMSTMVLMLSLTVLSSD